MDKRKLMYITRALDISITSVLKLQVDQLAEGLGPKVAAQSLLSSLRSLEALQQGRMPEYNAWDAVLYGAWYQPSHINMAYTLIRRVPYQFNPLLNCRTELYVEDFGCGQLAMQFGLLLVALDALEESGVFPRISIRSTDPSDEMKEIGWQIWRRFEAEISDSKKYPLLHGLREAMSGISFHGRLPKDCERWISLLHVAYQGSKDSVRENIGPIVEKNRPGAILVTYHRGAKENAFSPSDRIYKEEVHHLSRANLDLAWNFQRLTELRESLYEERVKGILDNLQDDSFAKSYLTTYPSTWVSHRFESECSVHLRADADPAVDQKDLDDLPF